MWPKQYHYNVAQGPLLRRVIERVSVTVRIVDQKIMKQNERHDNK